MDNTEDEQWMLTPPMVVSYWIILSTLWRQPFMHLRDCTNHVLSRQTSAPRMCASRGSLAELKL